MSHPDLKSIFAEALERPDGPGRAAYLDGACRGDAALRAEVEGMVRDRERLGRFLASGRDARPDVTASVGPVSSGTLGELAETLGGLPRVLLQEAEPAGTAEPLVQAASPELPPPAERDGRYQLFGEIARGGMGAVLKGRDPDLGRDVAVKVLLEEHRGDVALVRRFVEEAQIGGQLQHPGIVPVYDVGSFADRRPFFTMKLVKGHTLAALLRGRPHPADGLPRSLGIFEQVCQTVAYAHARGVIHRDLKPSNVMVGGFGEVQVMDWGLAKLLPRGGAADDAAAGKTDQETVVATARSGGPDPDLSRAGSVLGTPSYMAPEQARGEVDRLDERADVFALGSILCEVLTGEPAFTGRGSLEVLRSASRGEMGEALGRLDGCGADAELVALARDCLAPDRDDRPRDASVVAGRVTAYLAGVQERVKAAERRRAVAEATAVEERKRRKLQVGLAASLLVLTTLGGLGTTYYLQQRAARAAAIDRLVGQAETLRTQAMAHADDVARWQVALATVDQADARGDARSESRLSALRGEIQSGLDAARRDRELVDLLVDIRSAEADDTDGSTTDLAYADAFRKAGIDVVSLPPAEAGAKVRARPPGVALALAAALDDWAAIRRGKRGNLAGAAALGAAARVADPDPWRNELRAALDRSDKPVRLAALQALAKTARIDELGPVGLQLLGNGLKDAGDSELAETLLRSAQQHYPGDVWINYVLGTVLERLSRSEEAIRFYTAARAIRPETAHELAHALDRCARTDEAIAVFRDLRRLRPGNARHLTCLGWTLRYDGQGREADEVMDAALAAARERVELRPEDSYAHSTLGSALQYQWKYEEAITAFRAAVRLKPDSAPYHLNLGRTLALRQEYDEAAAELRTAIRLGPDDADTHFFLGRILQSQGKPDEAIAAFRTAMRLKPDDADAYCQLGLLLRRRRDFAGALEMLRRGHELGSRTPGWLCPSQKWVDDAERMLTLSDRVPAMLRGEDSPRDNAERLTFAVICIDARRYATAARQYSDAFEADPKLGDDRDAEHRFFAAYYALCAAAGRGKDDPPPDEHAKTKLRAQAHEWLSAELAAWGLVLDRGDAKARKDAANSVRGWKQLVYFAEVRDPDALDELPEAERAIWRSFWEDVETLLRRARQPANASGTP
jgi:serine/threonine-protein kinase